MVEETAYFSQKDLMRDNFISNLLALIGLSSEQYDRLITLQDLEHSGFREAEISAVAHLSILVSAESLLGQQSARCK